MLTTEQKLMRLLHVVRQRASQPEGGSERAVLREIGEGLRVEPTCDMCAMRGDPGRIEWTRDNGCDIGKCDYCDHQEVIIDEELGA